MAKLTLNVDPDIIKKGKRYAQTKGKSLSALVENYIKSVASKEERPGERKIPDAIKKLSGAIKLPKEYDTKRFTAALDQKIFMRKIFIDINIALDLLLQREPFYTDVEDLFILAYNKKIELFIAAHSFVIIDYVASKAMSFSKRKTVMLNFKKWVTVLPLNDDIISAALLSENDFEDEIQQLIAVQQKADVLITHDIKGFKNCPLSVMTAKQFVITFKI